MLPVWMATQEHLRLLAYIYDYTVMPVLGQTNSYQLDLTDPYVTDYIPYQQGQFPTWHLCHQQEILHVTVHLCL